MKQHWYLPALLALVMWGAWGFLPKLTVKYINPVSGVVFETIGVAAVGLAMFLGMGSALQISAPGIVYAVLTGIVGLLGAYFYLMAMTTGKVSVVVTVTALYPVITIGLAWLVLKEPITPKEGVGMALAVAAIVMLTT